MEILTQPGHQPSRDWLAVVKTSRARNRIRHLINAVERAKAVEIGQKSLEKEARRMGVSLGRLSNNDMATVASEYGVSKPDDLYAALGFGRFSARQVLQKVMPEENAPEAPAPLPLPPRIPQLQTDGALANGDLTIHVKGADDVLVFIARSAATQFAANRLSVTITRGKGIAVSLGTMPQRAKAAL